MTKTLHISCEEYDFSSLAAAFEGEYVSDCPLALEVVIVGEEEIREFNSKFRAIDRVTDVLSFPTLDGIKNTKILKRNFPYDVAEDGSLFIGSIAVCRQVAERQAEEYGHSFERELNYLVTHGVCHLLGYDHMQEDEKREMREKEERVLKKLGLSRD